VRSPSTPDTEAGVTVSDAKMTLTAVPAVLTRLTLAAASREVQSGSQLPICATTGYSDGTRRAIPVCWSLSTTTAGDIKIRP